MLLNFRHPKLPPVVALAKLMPSWVVGHSTRMTHDELIAKARGHMKPFDHRDSFGVSSGVFTEARVRETALVVLGSQQRDDYIEVYVDRQTGEFITATYHPRSQKQGSAASIMTMWPLHALNLGIRLDHQS